MKRDLQKWCQQLAGHADWIGLREYSEKVHEAVSRDGILDGYGGNSDSGIMVEVLIDGQFAYGATDSYSFFEIEQITKDTVARAKAAAKFKLFEADLSLRPKVTGNYSSLFSMPLDLSVKKEIVDSLLHITNILKAGKNIISSQAYSTLVESEMHFVSSNGSDFTQVKHMHAQDFFAIAQGKSTPQKRSFNRLGQGPVPFLKKDIPLAEVERVLREAQVLADAKNCPEQNMSVIIAPDQLVLQVHESIGHPLELDRIIGDERNYAGWSFIKPTDFGELQYGSELLNITFDPTVETEIASYAIDDTGVSATKEYLIKDGKLLRGLGSLESQTRSGLKGVASTRATSWNRAPIDRMANINLEAGESSFSDMVSQVENGILMHSNRSWSIDDYRNKFQFGCEYGQLIKDGELKEVVKNPNYRGVTTPFWHNLAAVGDSDSFEVSGSYYCGKGEPNQIIRVGHAMPSCLFNDIDVFGGEQ